MSKTYSNLIEAFGIAITAHLKPYRRANARAHASEKLVQRWVVNLAFEGQLYFECPTGRSLHDLKTPYNDEPETIKWLNAMPERASFWDVGANIGLYTLYAAKTKEAKVLAFEPSSESYAALMNNIKLNSFEDQIIPLCFALNEKELLSRLYMKSTEAGASMHSFDSEYSAEGKINVGFAQPTIGFSADFLLATFDLPPPEFVKIDVDGNEARILRGGREIFMEHTRSLIIEVESFVDKSLKTEVINELDTMGFREVKDFCPNARRNSVFENRKYSEGPN